VATGSEVVPWSEIARQFERGAILVGNGLSVSVSPSFAYTSLFEVARSEVDGRYVLSPDDVQVFDHLGSRDFEQVLASLQIAALVCGQTGHDTSEILSRYERIKRSLLAAVRSVHPRHGDIAEDRLRRIQATLTTYSHVFTTNYDLLIYWATVEGPQREDFRDYFWTPPGLSFDLTNARAAEPSAVSTARQSASREIPSTVSVAVFQRPASWRRR
jgi:hypothetical protein